MKRNHFLIAFAWASFALIACEESQQPSPGRGGGSNNQAWIIPEGDVFDGGPGKDGIPSIDEPIFTDAANAPTDLQDNSLVVGVKIGNEAKAYPHFILDWHEIVNDGIGDTKYALNYCPLTGTAMAWSRIINNFETTFGVSGLLYQTNIIPYDRQSNSNWSQLQMRAVQGPLVERKAEVYAVVETDWKTWREMYPNTQVMTTETGFNRSYGVYPYGNYRTDNSTLLFPVDPLDQRVPAKERVHSIRVGDQLKSFRQSLFSDNTTVINDLFNNEEIVIAGNANSNLFVSFGRKLEDGTILELNAVQNGLPIIMTDQEANEWDVFGVAVSGPREGEQLPIYPSLMAYWFSMGAFYPDHQVVD
ncbi:MAG: DUF3179 domain-containing protein [Bacteroidota bacterium]